jgi:lipoprotein-anchoring transpeptidase ErfK/SrfK
MTEDSKMKCANALRSSVAVGALLRVAALGTVLTIATAAPADAQLYYRDAEPGYYNQQQFAPPPPRRQQRARKPSKKEIIKDTAVHPQMPLIINVSIAKQRVRIYDANGLFAEGPVSTGMPGHGTPMGVFSVIQKDRYHHSNIYSGAPMPYMQRITWGGVALHAGVLPGYPASHGCIRMPESFAVKMWGWTKMGARVIVSPGELSPATFEHALLPAMKVLPQPQVSEQVPDAPLAPKADKGASDIKPIEAKLELRSTVGHGDEAPPRDQTRTADASGNGQTNKATMSDASPAREAVAGTNETKADSAKPDDAKADTAKDESAPSRATGTVGHDVAEAGDAAKNNAAATSGRADVAGAATPADKPAASDKPADVAAAPESKPNPAEAAAISETAKSEPVKTETPKLDTGRTDEPAEAVKPANGADADAKKDQTRLSGSDKPPKPDARRREGQLAVFISRKDSKLYVRQNFAPAWAIPVTIAPSDRPLGTHVFTAVVDKADSNLLHWSVVSVPMSARAAMRDSDEPRHSRRKGKQAPVAEARPAPLPDSPAEALDRITIPADAIARISEAMASGGSVIVSDQGINQGETGEYTDFIIRTY